MRGQKGRLLTGETFGRLIVVGPSDDKRHNQQLWLCRCTCGNEKIAPGNTLLSGGVKSCGCLRREKSMAARIARLPDLTGKRFGRLTVTHRADERISHQIAWHCACDCGGETLARTHALNSGAKQSCGCLRGGKATALGHWSFSDLTGQRFGRLVVAARAQRGDEERGRTRFVCQCDCGNTVTVNANNLLCGDGKHTTSCGCRQKEARHERRERKHHAWKGGRRRNQDGYIVLVDHTFPYVNKRFQVLEHVKVMSDALGRRLRPNETVHHKNGIRDDNRLENLELWASNHAPGQRVVDLVAFSKGILSDYCSPDELRAWVDTWG